MEVRMKNSTALILAVGLIVASAVFVLGLDRAVSRLGRHIEKAGANARPVIPPMLTVRGYGQQLNEPIKLQISMGGPASAP
jgi:hypothetical protein